MPNVYVPDDTFAQYARDEGGDLGSAKDRIQEVVEKHAPEDDGR